MSGKILVAFASKRGSTVEIAETIGETFVQLGEQVDVRDISTIDSVSEYQSVIIGSAIRVGHWLPEAVKFVETHREALSKIPVAYFIVCITMTEDTLDNRHTVLTYLDPVFNAVPEVHPVDVGMFAGNIDMEHLPITLRLMVKAVHAPVGDFRDYEAVRQWVRGINGLLMPA